MFKKTPALTMALLLALFVFLPVRGPAQNATAPAARQDNASNKTEEDLLGKAIQRTKAVPVQIKHDSTDQAGRRLIFHIRERFSESGLFRLSDKEEQKIVIHMESRREFPDRPGISSIYAATWTFSYGEDVLSNYLESRTGIAGMESLGATAEEFVARTYEIYSRYSYLFEEE
ncbi:MAG: hypothetical protein K9K39_03465 [Desulfohalobiaceae bacterium]|nr:hypothetical protein [Desulfohalobiaceae bacterium]